MIWWFGNVQNAMYRNTGYTTSNNQIPVLTNKQKKIYIYIYIYIYKSPKLPYSRDWEWGEGGGTQIFPGDFQNLLPEEVTGLTNHSSCTYFHQPLQHHYFKFKSFSSHGYSILFYRLLQPTCGFLASSFLRF
jgi:hypothetical protein